MKGAPNKCAMAEMFIILNFFFWGTHQMAENPYFFTDYLCSVSHSKVKAILNISILKGAFKEGRNI